MAAGPATAGRSIHMVDGCWSKFEKIQNHLSIGVSSRSIWYCTCTRGEREYVDIQTYGTPETTYSSVVRARRSGLVVVCNLYTSLAS
jgi:hypothetical protein